MFVRRLSWALVTLLCASPTAFAFYVPLYDIEGARKEVACVEKERVVLKSCDLGVPLASVDCGHKDCVVTMATGAMTKIRFREVLRAMAEEKNEKVDTGSYPRTEAGQRAVTEALSLVRSERTQEKLKRYQQNLEAALKVTSAYEAIAEEVISEKKSGPYTPEDWQFAIIRSAFEREVALVAKRAEEAKAVEIKRAAAAKAEANRCSSYCECHERGERKRDKFYHESSFSITGPNRESVSVAACYKSCLATWDTRGSAHVHDMSMTCDTCSASTSCN